MIAKLNLFSPKPAVTNPQFKSVNENLYRQNMELAVKNKTLLLLRQLYEISIQTLDVKSLCGQVTARICSALSFEFVGIYLWDEAGDKLDLAGYASSERLSKYLNKHSKHFESLSISRPKEMDFYRSVLDENLPKSTDGLAGVFGQELKTEDVLDIEHSVKVKTSLVYPLVIQHKISATLILSLNRTYAELNSYEKESIVSIINVISVAMEKAFIYHQLTVANDKLKELDKKKTEFVSIASHQLRSPLTAIKGYSSLLLEGSFGELNDKAREAVDRVFQSSQKLVLVIEDFLNISRIELGTMRYEWSDFDLRETVEAIVKDMRPMVEKNQLAFSFDYDTNLKYLVHADAGKISQVVSNLIDNATKYTKTGSIRVRLEKKVDRVRLVVEDTGVGIAQDTMPLLFAKFSRASDAGKTNIAGTGLGLYVAKEIVAAHKGKIWAESDGPGQGSRFIVEL